MPSIDYFNTVVAIAASLTTLVIAHKTVSRPAYALCVRIKKNFNEISDLPAKVDRIMTEVTPSGGGSLKDIVNRIEARQVVDETRQHAYISHSPIPFYETDKYGKVTWVNRAYERLVGMSSASLEGRGWLNYVSYEDRGKVMKAWDEALVDGRDFAMDYQVITANSALVTVRAEATATKSSNDEVLGYVGSIQILRPVVG